MVCVRLFSVSAIKHGEKLIKHSRHMNIYVMTSDVPVSSHDNNLNE